MRIFTFCLILTLFVVFPSSGFSATAQPNAQTWLNNTTDYFATLGKSDSEKKNIIRSRKNERRRYRQEKSKRERKAAIQKKMERQNAAIMKKIEAKNSAKKK